MKKKEKLLLLVGLIVVVLAISHFVLRGGKPSEVFSPQTITDHSGYETLIDHEPQKIVSLVPSNTEILYALGLGERVVGVSNFCDYPAEATQKPKVGDINIDFETILQLEPDLILTTGGMIDDTARLRELGMKVVVVEPKDLEEVLESIIWIGGFTGASEKATEIVEEMTKRIKKVRDFAAKQEIKPRVFYEVWDDPLMTAGPGTFINSLITEAGGRDIAQNLPEQWAVYSLETLLYEDPEIILVTWDDISKVYERETWQEISAVKNKRVAWIDQNIIARPGPRIVDALEEIQRILFSRGD